MMKNTIQFHAKYFTTLNGVFDSRSAPVAR